VLTERVLIRIPFAEANSSHFEILSAFWLTQHEYSPSPQHWRGVGGSTGIHVDTWAMVFPSWYDAGKGDCAAYAADGGVFFNLGKPGLSLASGI